MGITRHQYEGEDYKTLICFESWRVAVLNYSDNQTIEEIKYLEQHNKTDEVFVLLKGSAYILDGGTGKKPRVMIKAVKLEKDVFYNVKKSTWHAAIMKKRAKILIVENRDTGDKNSKLYFLSSEEKTKIKIK